MLKDYKITTKAISIVDKWDGYRWHYELSVNRLKFDYYGSIYDKEKGTKDLSHDDNLFAFRLVLSDSLTALEYLDNYLGFLHDFGYLDSELSLHDTPCLEDHEEKMFNIGKYAFQGCEENLRKIKLTEDELISLLDELSDVGID